MSSINIYIIVEGYTEQTFIRDVLAPEFANKKLFLYPVLIGKSGHKGGDVRFERAEKDIGILLKQRKNTYITTMFDYFRINPEWPGLAIVQQRIRNGNTLHAIEKAELLENETMTEIANSFSSCNVERRFIPYIGMHEFEALLFSDTTILAEKMNLEESAINEILDCYDNPEEINDNPEKAPSKRLEALVVGYRKVAMGKVICESIGIAGIRKKCPHFNAWLTKLENLKNMSCAV